MGNFTKNTYETKRKIFEFCKKLASSVGQVDTKFINTVDRLSSHLAEKLPSSVEKAYLETVTKLVDDESPTILADDSDVVKKYGKSFESLDRVKEQKCTFVFDRGYDMNELFNFMYEKEQDFIIRLTEKKKNLLQREMVQSTHASRF